MPSWRTRAEQARYGKSTRRRRRTRRRRVVLIVGAVVLVWLGVTAALLALAARDARAAEDRLRDLEGSVSGADLLRGEGVEDLRRAHQDLRAGNRKASNPIVKPLQVLPVIGRQVRAFQGMLGGSSRLLGTGVEALDATREQLDGDLPQGAARVELVSSLEAVLNDAMPEVLLASQRLGPRNGLVQPLAEAHEDIVERIEQVTVQLGRAHSAFVAMESFLEGDGRYLVLASNNAEMQSGWGMPLQAGVLTVTNGQAALPDLEPTSDMVLPVGVPFEGDLADNWGSLQPNREWRNLALTPRFSEAAPLAARMWEARGGGPVDGVLAVDPYLLRAILRATGPVQVGGDVVTAEDVVPFTLHDQYIGQGIEEPGRAERQDRLSDVAAAAVDALGGEVDGPVLVEQLMQASYQRHILAWSSIEEQQAGWEASGIDGELDAGSTMVSLVNRGCNKLDWFVDVSADLTFEAAPEGRQGVLRVAIDNKTPEGQAPYIAGPRSQCGVDAAGDWLGFLTVHLPGRVGRASVQGAGLIVDGSDGPTRLVAANVAVARGQRVEAVVRFDVPSDVVDLELEPSGRARPLTWRVGQRSWSDDRRHTVPLAGDRR